MDTMWGYHLEYLHHEGMYHAVGGDCDVVHSDVPKQGFVLHSSKYTVYVVPQEFPSGHVA